MHQHKAIIVNTDQGSQFTAEEFVKVVKDRAVSTAWTDEELGGIMFLLNGYGNR